MSELIDAVYDNDIDLVGQLLNNNVDIELQDQYENTALIWAINRAPDGYGSMRLGIEVSIEVRIEVIRLLLENGANPNIQNNEGTTALMKASQYIERIEIVELLLEYGANLNLQNEDGESHGNRLYISVHFSLIQAWDWGVGFDLLTLPVKEENPWANITAHRPLKQGF